MSVTRDPFWNRVLEVSDVLVYSFDFEVLERPLGVEAYATEASWLPAFVVPDAAVSVLGRTGVGSVYAWCERGPLRCCLHIDARGTVLRVGDDLPHVVALIVALPYWPELLAQCPGGQLSALRDAAQRLEEEVCEDLHQLPAARQELQTFLDLPPIADPVLHLYELAVEQPPVTVWSPHGWRYESRLIGSGPRAASV